MAMSLVRRFLGLVKVTVRPKGGLLRRAELGTVVLLPAIPVGTVAHSRRPSSALLFASFQVGHLRLLVEGDCFRTIGSGKGRAAWVCGSIDGNPHDDIEAAPHSGAGSGRDLPTPRLHESPHDCQPQPGSARPRGEVRLEDAGELFL